MNDGAVQEPDSTATSRDAQGRWLPGHSPNPGGRPAKTREVREYAQQHALAAIERLTELMKSKDEQVAVSACRALLDRAVGKPTQAISVDAMPPPQPGAPIADAQTAALVYAEVMSGNVDLDTVNLTPHMPAQLEYDGGANAQVAPQPTPRLEEVAP